VTPQEAWCYDRLAAVLGRRGPVLDVGAGSGAVAAWLSDRGVPLVLLDVVDGRGPAARLFPFVLGDAAELPLRSSSCAGAHLARVLYHLPDWRRALGEVARVLVPGAALCLSLGGRRYGPRLRVLVDTLDTEAARHGVLVAPLAGDLRGPGDVDAELARHGMSAAEPLEVDFTVPVTPREAVEDTVAHPCRWAAGQDLSPLAELGARVLATCGLDPDRPLPQPRVLSYRLYRRG
jgi:SAM-dependent methyltransferase